MTASASCATVVVLVAIAMGLFLGETNADALVPALISTQRLTFFYWGQDRLASLVPLLAWPARDAIWNFYVQSAVLGASFFALVALFAGFHLRRARPGAGPMVLPLSTLAAGLLVIVLVDPITGYTFVFEQPYALSTTVFLLGIRATLADHTGLRVLGTGLILVAALLNPFVVALCPVAFLLDDGPGAVRRAMESVAIAVVALVVSMLASSWFHDGPTQAALYRDFSARRAIDALPTVIRQIAVSVRFVPAALIVVAAVAVLLVRRAALPSRLRLAYVGAPLFGIVWLVVFSGNRWVEVNLHSPRYFFPLYGAALLLITGGAAEATAAIVERLEARPTRRTTLRTLIAGIYAVAAVAAVVGAARARSIPVLDEAEPVVELAATSDVQLVAGTYWQVWPAVVRGRSEGLDLWGVTERSVAVRDEIVSIVEGELGAAGRVQAVCVDDDRQVCVDWLSAVTGRAWAPGAAPDTSPAPRILQVTPAGP